MRALGCSGRAQNAPRRRRKGLVERACRVCRQVVEHEADFLGVWEVDVDEIAHAACEVLRRPPVRDLDPAPGSVGVEEDKEIGRAVAPIFAVETLQLSRPGGNGQARLADDLGRAFVEADDRALWVWLLVVEIEHILHAGDVFGVDLGNAPHVLAPRLEVILQKPAADGLAGEFVMVGQLDHFAGQQLERPAGPSRRRVCTGRCNQEGFLLAGKFAPGARAWLFAQSRLQTAFHEPALGAVDRRAAGADRSLDLLIADAIIRGQEDLRPLQSSCGAPAAA